MKLLPVIPRTPSGYRIFNEQHLAQLRLLRTAFHTEIISGRLRQEVFTLLKISATGDYAKAYHDTAKYLAHLREEKARAEEAIRITMAIVEHTGSPGDEACEYSGRLEAAAILGITADVLRDWERNGLIHVPRQANGYRKYTGYEINRLKIIRTLRNAHYSMMSILRMLNHLDQGDSNIREIIDTPGEEENVVCAADRYITALNLAENDALEMLQMLDTMRLNKI